MRFWQQGEWWLPEGEEHLQEWMMHPKVTKRVHGRLTYQYQKYEMALKFCKQRRYAVDIGAHVGLWSFHMAHDFERVVSFEPVVEHIKCFHKNMSMCRNVELWQFALGAEHGRAYIKCRTPGSSGDTGIDPVAERSSLRASIDTSGQVVEIEMLDRFNLQSVDFMKIDCEGFELFVLQGGTSTLLRNKPCVIVEQKEKTGMCERYGVGPRDAVTYLESLGAMLCGEISGDYIMAWE